MRNRNYSVSFLLLMLWAALSLSCKSDDAQSLTDGNLLPVGEEKAEIESAVRTLAGLVHLDDSLMITVTNGEDLLAEMTVEVNLPADSTMDDCREVLQRAALEALNVGQMCLNISLIPADASDSSLVPIVRGDFTVIDDGNLWVEVSLENQLQIRGTVSDVAELVEEQQLLKTLSGNEREYKDCLNRMNEKLCLGVYTVSSQMRLGDLKLLPSAETLPWKGEEYWRVIPSICFADGTVYALNLGF